MVGKVIVLILIVAVLFACISGIIDVHIDADRLEQVKNSVMKGFTNENGIVEYPMTNQQIIWSYAKAMLPR